MLTVVLGLLGAMTYGVSDFLGGVGSRTARPIVVTAIAAVVGIVPLVAAVPLLHARFTGHALLWGSVAGIAGSVGVLLLYAALAIGPMSVLSPVTSVFAAVVPVVVGVVAGVRLGPVAIAAIIAAVVAVVLVATSSNGSSTPLTLGGLGIAAVSGCGFGVLVIAYARTDAADGIAPLVVARVIQAIVMWTGVLVVVARSRRAAAAAPAGAEGSPDRAPLLPVHRRFWVVVVACGCFDASANVFIQAALHVSDDPAALPVVSVLDALYPIGTILLAAIVLRERLSRVQVAGLVLGFAASATLALA
ncbi:EamA/RhaT family transporter [Curtobacterium sp. MCBD17_028]|uniref:EamA/RhaT family transporter n=1 Tax=Curtobacterium sp. MCBD17_028 TaxID=2175670 RepID=UPI000DA97F8F|nr:EamA/RhaT family transporter [Curtobacterium sp. MCBD17_028]PZE24007.1 EamA/RhaT family transporter [Curtobacterium sp. MCBD17_028]